jgi:hypothetical protein
MVLILQPLPSPPPQGLLLASHDETSMAGRTRRQAFAIARVFIIHGLVGFGEMAEGMNTKKACCLSKHFRKL